MAQSSLLKLMYMPKRNADVADLTPELRTEFLSFLTEVNGHFEVADTQGLLMFIVEHGEQYPTLYNLFDVNEEAVIEHFETYQAGTTWSGINADHDSRGFN